MYKLITTAVIFMITVSAFGFTITLTEDHRLPGEFTVSDSGDTRTVDRLPADSTWYTVASYGSGIEFIASSDTLFTAPDDWDTVTIPWRQAVAVDIYTDARVLVFPNDTSEIAFILDADRTLEFTGLDRELARLIFFSVDSARVSVNAVSYSAIGAK